VVDEQPLPVGLVLRPGAIQLPRVKDLPGVVDRDAEPDETRVEGDAHAIEARDDRLGGLAYQPHVRHEPRRAPRRRSMSSAS
jgi:hypothetical protein